jgi:hypothetical protein
VRLKSFANADATYQFKIAVSELNQRGTPLRAGDKVVFDGRLEDAVAKPAKQDLPLIRGCIVHIRRLP